MTDANTGEGKPRGFFEPMDPPESLTPDQVVRVLSAFREINGMIVDARSDLDPMAYNALADVVSAGLDMNPDEVAAFGEARHKDGYSEGMEDAAALIQAALVDPQIDR